MHNIEDISLFGGMRIKGLHSSLEKIIRTPLNYEITDENDVKLDFITGYNDDEKKLPVFDHPVIIEDYKGIKHIVTDLRKYCKAVTEQPIELADVINNKAGAKFVINRAIMNLKLLREEIGSFKTVQNSFTTLFAIVVSNAINQIVTLSPRDVVLVEVLSSVYLTNKFSYRFSKSERESIYAGRVSQLNLSFGSPKSKDINGILKDVDTEMVTFDDLIIQICNIIPDLKNRITTNAVVVAVSNWWYGPGGVSTMAAHFEHLPTLLALYYTVNTDTTYKRNKLAMIANKNKKKINLEAINSMIKIIKEFSEV